MFNYKKYLNKKNIFIVLLLVIVSIVLYLFLPIFNVKKIIILGNTSLKPDEIHQYTTQNIKKNTFLVDKKKMELDFLKSPYINTIKIKSKFPNKLIINIIERKAIASIKFSGGFAIVDDSGVVLETTSDILKVKKPIVSGITIKELIVGEELLNQNDKIKLGMEIISNIKSAKILNNISLVDISNVENIYMVTPQGINVLIGEGKNLNEKMIVLEKILLNLHERGKTSGYVDMRYDSYPVYRSQK